MPEPTQNAVPRTPSDRRDVQGRRVVDRRDGQDQRREIDRRGGNITMNVLERRVHSARRSIPERRLADLRVAARRDSPDRRN